MAEGTPKREGPTTNGHAPDSRARPLEKPRPLTDSLTTGVLVKHGRAPFEFRREAAESYYVTVRTDRGERTLWGRGLERALVESRTQPKPGDAIGVRENGIEPMTVITRERDASGQVRLEKRLDTPRGHWVVERREFFDERAIAAQALRDPRVSRREAVRNHPELLGAYWALDSAGKIAEARIANPASRERFVALVREALAHATERGEPLPPARRRERDAKEADPGQRRATDPKER